MEEEGLQNKIFDGVLVFVDFFPSQWLFKRLFEVGVDRLKYVFYGNGKTRPIE